MTPIHELCDGSLGCTCPKKRAKIRQRRKDVSQLPHGQRSTYLKGCPCRPCNQANNEYQAEYNRNRKIKETS